MSPIVAPSIRPPAVLLGGGRNALSVARSLGRKGIKVYAISNVDDPSRFSRYVECIDMHLSGTPEDCWARYLLGPLSNWLKGSVLLSTSDAGILLLNQHRKELEKKFILDAANPPAQIRMLFKHTTYQEAVRAGVPTPKWWLAESVEDIHALRDELVFPMIVKPLLSYLFVKAFSEAKYIRVDSYKELQPAYLKVRTAGIPCMLVEYIPGGDELLCSYYTYIDTKGRRAFRFTKHVVRRYPSGMGLGSCHVTDHDLEVCVLAEKLFESSGLRGMANAEFKRDPRDGMLKLIECNARFTAATHLAVAAGIDMGLFVYNHLTGGPAVRVNRYRKAPIMLWDPYRDFLALRERRVSEGLSVIRWLHSIRLPLVFPVFTWDDPRPTFEFVREVVRILPRKLRRFSVNLATPVRQR
jgi:D-aspartate ligase